MLVRKSLALLLFPLISSISTAGYIGGGHLFTTTKTFDTQEEGLRVDFGSNVNSSLDLEWGYVEFGDSEFNNPDFLAPDLTDDDDSNDRESFENLGFGEISGDGGGLHYTGIQSLKANGLSAGMKLKLRANNWLTLFGRVSFLAWQAETTQIELYAEREPLDENGDETTDPNEIDNYTPCGNLSTPADRCEVISEGKTHWAVDFWYGYGALIQPDDWMAIRTEYSIVTLNAVEFPKSVLEGFSTSLEIHF